VNKKLIISLVSIVGGALLLLVIVKVVIGASARRQQRREEELAQEQAQQPPQTTDPGTEVAPTPEQPTWSPSTYRQMANELYEAMDSTWWAPWTYGTAETRLVSIFCSLNNNADFEKLNSAFGKRDGYTMRQWVKSELSSYYVNEINHCLSSNNITHKI
jgi:hypothetical protein